MATKLKSSLTFNADTGITISNSGIEFDASEPLTQVVSIGQDIGTTSNVQFNAVTASGYNIGSFTLLADRWTNDFDTGGNMSVTSNFTMTGSQNATINGKVTAEEIIAELSSSTTIFKSGSTQFGDSIDDSHYITGSLNNSGSFLLDGYTVTGISSDAFFTESSSLDLATESASAAYTSRVIGSANEPTDTDLYIRKNYSKTATVVSNNTASFHSVLTASAPAGVNETTESDYLCFINGQVMEHDALSIQQSYGTFYVLVDPDSIGYNLDSRDEVRAWGKFESDGQLHFDGENDEVNTNFSGSSGLGTDTPSPKTYSFWAKSSETDRNYSPFGWGSNKKAFTFNFNDNRPLRWWGNHWYVYWDDTSAQDDGQWHHWMVYDSPSELSGSKLYVDGTLIPINLIVSSSETGAADFSQNLTIGSYRDNSAATNVHFSGSLKEFSVFGGDKTSYASTYYNNGTPYDVTNETDLQAYWKMTEGVGSTVYDFSGNTNSNGVRYDGTIKGATWEELE